MNKSSTYSIALFGVGIAVLCMFFLSHVEITANDDVYVYFNYARNLVEGRPFAYDSRGIPSEGFTSMLYLLMLVPFEYFNMNMMFAGFLLNVFALLSTVYLAALLAKTSGLIKGSPPLLFPLVFFAALVFDTNIRGLIGWSFETLLNPLFTLACFLFFEKALSDTGNKGIRWLPLFFLSYFAAFMVRPENLAIIGSLALLLSILHQDRKQFSLYALAFSILLGAFLILKYAYFHDIFPTGFYRKVSMEALPGKDYVLSALKEYRLHGVLLLAVFSAFLITSTLKRRRVSETSDSPHSRIALSSALSIYRLPLAMALVALVNVLFFLKVNPLVGIYFRFLIIPIITIYFLLALFVVKMTGRGLLANLPHALFFSLTLAIIAIMVFVSHDSTKGLASLADINVYRKTIEQTAAHHYLRFGNYMREHLSKPEDITMVMGDAGAVPYSFHCKFIDSNGLTEPYIARLFGNVPDKTSLFVNYIKRQQSDIFIIGYTRPDPNGVLSLFENEHSPLNTDEQFETLKAFQDYGIKYVGSLEAYYDLHIGLREDSEHFNELRNVLTQYLLINGYILKDGLYIQHNGEFIHFEPAQN